MMQGLLGIWIIFCKYVVSGQLRSNRVTNLSDMDIFSKRISQQNQIIVFIHSPKYVTNNVYQFIFDFNISFLRMADGRVVDKALMDYVSLPRQMLGRLLDVKVRRGEGGDCLTIFWWKLG